MASRYFVNGGVDNNWGTTGNWSTTSGGGGGSSVPSSSDDVFFDASSPACTVNSGATRVCRQLDCTGYTSTLTLDVGLTATPQTTGAVKLAAGMTITGTGALTLTAATGGSMTITSAGIGVGCPLTLGGNSATVTLADNWDVNATLTLGTAAASLTINGNQISFSGALSLPQTSGTNGGTTVFVADGTGTWTSSGAILVSSLTINTAGTFTVSGTVRYRTGTFTYTAGTVVTTGSTLSIADSTTLNCAGMTWNNVSLTNTGTWTLSADWNIGGNLTMDYVIGSSMVFTGHKINISGNLVCGVTNQMVISGTAELVMVGTGSITTFSTSRIQNSLTINTAGTTTFSGTVNYRDGTLTYTAGTVAGTSTPILNISSGTSTVFDLNGLVLPCLLQIAAAGVVLKLASEVKIGGSGGGLNLSGTSASHAGIKSNSTPTTRKLTIQPGAVITSIYCDFTDIDCSDGDELWEAVGTLSNTSNISVLMPYTSPLDAFVGSGGGGGGPLVGGRLVGR